MTLALDSTDRIRAVGPDNFRRLDFERFGARQRGSEVTEQPRLRGRRLRSRRVRVPRLDPGLFRSERPGHRRLGRGRADRRRRARRRRRRDERLTAEFKCRNYRISKDVYGLPLCRLPLE